MDELSNTQGKYCAERVYKYTHELYELLDFDPENDVRVSSEGLLEWVTDNPKLRKALEEYFLFRNEEGNNVFTPFIIDKLESTKKELAAMRSSGSYKAAVVFSKAFNIVFFHPILKKAAKYILKLFFCNPTDFLINFTNKVKKNCRGQQGTP